MNGLTERLLSTYVNVRAAMRREIDAWPSEPQLFFYLLLGCLLWFVAGIPFAVRDMAPDAGATLGSVLVKRIFGNFVFIPIVMYFLAAVSRIVSRIFGGSGEFINARLALFWAFLAAMPAVLAISLLGALGVILFGFPSAVVGLVVGLIEFSLILGFWAACLAEAEGFEHEAPVLAIMLAPILLGLLLHLTIDP